jgi:hypothetical protein
MILESRTDLRRYRAQFMFSVKPGPGAIKLENLLKSENILKQGNTQM